jgi:hypothetical protein
MNAPTPQTKGSSLTRPLSPRTSALILGIALLVALLGGGGWWLYERLDSGLHSPDEVKARIRKYLQKQTGQKDFKTDLAASWLTNTALWEPPPPPATNLSMLVTNLIGGTNRVTARTIRRLLSPYATPQNQITRQLSTQMNDALDYKTMYRVIGEHLWAADQLLEGDEPKKHEAGVLVAAEVSRVALSNAYSPWLAARISEGYLWPQMEFAESNKMRLDPDMLMGAAEDAFRAAGETNNLIYSYKLLITKAPQSSRADKARTRLAALLAQQGELAEALKYYKEVKSPNSRITSRIATLESRIKRKTKS